MDNKENKKRHPVHGKKKLITYDPKSKAIEKNTCRNITNN